MRFNIDETSESDGTDSADHVTHLRLLCLSLSGYVCSCAHLSFFTLVCLSVGFTVSLYREDSFSVATSVCLAKLVAKLSETQLL